MKMKKERRLEDAIIRMKNERRIEGCYHKNEE